jgi:formate dehydrogenase subunit gamma
MRIKTTGNGPAYLLVSILLVAGFLGGSAGIRAEQNDAGVNSVPNPGAELWRAVRERQEPLPPGQLPERPSTPGFVSDLSQTLLQAQGSEALSTQVKGVDAPVLINSFGEDWRRFRMEQLIPFGGYLLAGVLAVILVFALVRGRVRIDGGYSGKRLRRFTDFERVLHWFSSFSPSAV